MKNIFIINGGFPFAHSPGKFNRTLLEQTKEFFETSGNYQVKTTQIGKYYDLQEEVEKYQWADVIIYHTPIWWFQLPFAFKEYIDKVFTSGHDNGLYRNDGRSRENPAINYGTGGSLQGRKYIVTSSWNAPKAAFEMEGEFFDKTSVDEGILFGFHKMNKFIGLEYLNSIHFHDMEKNADVPKELNRYAEFLKENFI